MPSRAGRKHQQQTPRRRSTTARGLGHDHQENRTRLIARHRAGTPCWWCGKPMYADAAHNWDREPLHADHTTARSKGGKHAQRLLHATCNRQRGDGSRDHKRPTANPQTDDIADDLLGRTAMPFWDVFRSPTADPDA